jgi:hypothetical protein
MDMLRVRVRSSIWAPYTGRVTLLLTRTDLSIPDDIPDTRLYPLTALSEPHSKGIRVKSTIGIMCEVSGTDYPMTRARIMITGTTRMGSITDAPITRSTPLWR